MAATPVACPAATDGGIVAGTVAAVARVEAGGISRMLVPRACLAKVGLAGTATPAAIAQRPHASGNSLATFMRASGTDVPLEWDEVGVG